MEFQKLETELKLRGYTAATIRAYHVHNRRFLEFIHKVPGEIEREDVRNYLAYLLADKKQKPASVHLTLSSLKFFYEVVLKKKIFEDIKSPKKENKLPTVLTKQEIKKMIDVTGNKKHQLLIAFLYSSGLRVSEAVRIKIDDLDLQEKMGRVISGKGKKDRNIILGTQLIEPLRCYLEERKYQSPYVFYGEGGKEHLSVRMAQRIVQEAAAKAGIKKRVFCHAFRSSFATHLLEDGVDIRYIQALLGHASISTTERYTHVSTDKLKKIKSPFDSI